MQGRKKQKNIQRRTKGEMKRNSKERGKKETRQKEQNWERGRGGGVRSG